MPRLNKNIECVHSVILNFDRYQIKRCTVPCIGCEVLHDSDKLENLIRWFRKNYPNDGYSIVTAIEQADGPFKKLEKLKGLI